MGDEFDDFEMDALIEEDDAMMGGGDADEEHSSSSVTAPGTIDAEASLSVLVDDDNKTPTSPPPAPVGPLTEGERLLLQGLRRLSVQQQSASVGKLVGDNPSIAPRVHLKPLVDVWSCLGDFFNRAGRHR